jgi:hypothetical protein
MERKRKTNPALGRGSGPKTQCRGMAWPARSGPMSKSGPAGQPTRRVVRPGWSPRMEPPRWHDHQRLAVGQGAKAPVGLAPAGEEEGTGHSCGDSRSPGGRRDGGAGRRRSARRHISTMRVFLGLRRHPGGGSPTALRGK